MRIEVKMDFLEGTDRFLAGEVRVVSDELGAYFIENGWASEFGQPAAEPPKDPTTLDIKSVKHGVKGAMNG
jgi:hypothetical protein